jgi:hypothetical protein
MTTRPGYIWSGTEWVEIGQAAVVSPFKYQSTEPTSPATGDIWIDEDSYIPSVDTAVFYRWRKTMTGAVTSLSGNDDTSLPLTYTPNYEQVFLNGVLLVRNVDYTASTGTTITGLSDIVSGDVFEIMSPTVFSVANTYTQSVSDSRFVNRNVGGLNLVVPTGATGGTVGANGAVTIGSAVGSVTVQGAFSATYDNYLIKVSGGSSSTNTNMGFALTGATSGYQAIYFHSTYSATALSDGQTNASLVQYAGSVSPNGLHLHANISQPFIANMTRFNFEGGGTIGTYLGNTVGNLNNTNSYTGFTITPASGTITSGTIRVYGYNNGA